MKLSTYDILSMLIPGFVVLLPLLEVLGRSYDNDLLVGYTAVAVVIGYLVNTISSWLEDFYYWTWGGKPSTNLLQGKDTMKVRFFEGQKIKELLTVEAELIGTSINYDHLFAIAARIANGKKDSRVTDFNASYAFARVILTTTLIGSVLMLWKNYSDWRLYAVLLPALFITWLRCKQRGYYYAREVLNEYLNNKQPKVE